MDGGRTQLERARGSDHGVDVGELAPERPRFADRLTVLDQEGGAGGDHPDLGDLTHNAERTRGIARPVGEERHVDAERLRPGRMRPGGVA